jgi:tetratricopeptide (TPR) repeat protein
VRTASVEALDNAAPLYFTAHLWQGLNDPKRAVRIKTFEALAGVQMNQIPQDFLKAYEKVRKEFYDYQKATADFPGGQTNKALYYERTGQTQKALEAYKRAIEMDNYNNMARFNLANLYYRLGQMDMAEATFKKVMEQEPDYAETYYSLGLLYAELNRNTEAISQLRKALDLNIDNPRVYYNLGLLYQNGQSPEKAAEIFEKGLQRYPGHENLLYAMAYLQVQVLGDVPKARKYAHQLIKRYPDNENYQLFWKQLNAQ